MDKKAEEAREEANEELSAAMDRCMRAHQDSVRVNTCLREALQEHSTVERKTTVEETRMLEKVAVDAYDSNEELPVVKGHRDEISTTVRKLRMLGVDPGLAETG